MSLTDIFKRQETIEQLLIALMEKLDTMEDTNAERWQSFQQIIAPNHHPNRNTPRRSSGD